MMNLSRKIAVLAFFAVALATSLSAQQSQVSVPAALVAYPDLIVYNAKIVTMDDASLNNSPGRIAEAMAVRGDRIQFVGSNQEILQYAGPQTRKMDLKGRTVVPGLIDTHNHLHNGAVSAWAKKNPEKIEAIAKNFSITGKSFAEVTKGIELVIKENMAHPLPDQWAMIQLPGTATGTGIGVQYLFEKQMTRQQLDGMAPKMPVVITSAGGMGWLLNTAARNAILEMYEIEPTDENEKSAITTPTTFGRVLLTERYFDRHLSELEDVVANVLVHQAAGGFTTYSSHIVGLRFMPAFQKLAREERMPMRLAFSHRFCQELEPDNAGCFLRVGDWAGMGNKYFWNVGLTLGAIDGGPPQICTTMEYNPKYKAQEECLIQPGNNYYKAIYGALRSRYRYVVNHAYGDKAVDSVMDIMEQVMQENPDITMEFMRSLRVSSDHCGFYPRPSQLPRMKKLNMIISCNAMFVNRSSPWLPIYGADKANRISPIKAMLDAGVMPTSEYEGLNLGSGEGATPNAFLYHYITRRSDRGELIAPEEAIDRVSALKMSTVWASYFVLRENELGSLQAGKLADFAVFNKDYFTVPEAEIPTVFPLMTVMGGKTIVLREELAKDLGAPAVGPQLKFQFKTTYDFGDAVRSGRD